KIIPTESFKKDVKRLKKKNPRIAESLKELNKALQIGEYGTPLGKGTYKKRVKNLDLPKEKSSGFRVIGYKDVKMRKFYLMTIYSKSEKETVSEKEILELLNSIGVFS
ncbi:MAG: type II toxin-antitoxin system RelE/ParE family toxin, partial [bacterium]|nr:type II toxin-antitoxin system RelE/ParE family toxin [bacterium]